MPTVNTPRAVLARAITNDSKGVVSTTDARRLVDASLKDIEKAKDPQAAFENNMRLMDAARALAGENKSANRTLAEFHTKGMNAVSTRLGQLTGAGELPADVKSSFISLMSDLGALPVGGRVNIGAVKGNAQDGFSFSYTSGPNRGTAHATRMEDGWFLSPVKMTAAQLEKATAVARDWFDAEFAPDLREMGSTAAEIRDIRRKLTPNHAFFPGTSDPYNFTDEHPVVISFNNASDTDHGIYLGFDPAKGTGEAYAFN